MDEFWEFIMDASQLRLKHPFDLTTVQGVLPDFRTKKGCFDVVLKIDMDVGSRPYHFSATLREDFMRSPVNKELIDYFAKFIQGKSAINITGFRGREENEVICAEMINYGADSPYNLAGLSTFRDSGYQLLKRKIAHELGIVPGKRRMQTKRIARLDNRDMARRAAVIFQAIVGYEPGLCAKIDYFGLEPSRKLEIVSITNKGGRMGNIPTNTLTFSVGSETKKGDTAYRLDSEEVDLAQRLMTQY